MPVIIRKTFTRVFRQTSLGDTDTVKGIILRKGHDLYSSVPQLSGDKKVR